MQTLQKGQFFGDTNRRFELGGLTVTDTEYTHSKVDWYYHENPYFTFLLQGNMLEGNRTETYHCSAGTLLFPNWNDTHYNLKPPVNGKIYEAFACNGNGGNKAYVFQNTPLVIVVTAKASVCSSASV